jgi:hypothetical protein
VILISLSSCWVSLFVIVVTASFLYFRQTLYQLSKSGMEIFKFNSNPKHSPVWQLATFAKFLIQVQQLLFCKFCFDLNKVCKSHGSFFYKYSLPVSFV